MVRTRSQRAAMLLRLPTDVLFKIASHVVAPDLIFDRGRRHFFLILGTASPPDSKSGLLSLLSLPRLSCARFLREAHAAADARHRWISLSTLSAQSSPGAFHGRHMPPGKPTRWNLPVPARPGSPFF